MTARLIHFPARCVWILREDPAWLVLIGDHAWLFGDYRAALKDARWLSENSGLPIRSTAA
jgi:hypothetical protein